MTPGPVFSTDELRGFEATSADFPYVTGVVEVSLDDLVDWDLEGFLDVASELLVGNTRLMDVSYEAVGVSAHGQLRISVTGNVIAVLDDVDTQQD
jgi:hypothetical protein